MAEQALFELYRSLKLWVNPVCQRCRSDTPELSGPVAIWQVGREFRSDPHRLVFVGKNARGRILDDHEADDQLDKQGFIDGTRSADEWVRQKWSAYWSYTAGVVQGVFGSVDKGWEKVSFTNLVKCNASMN